MTATAMTATHEGHIAEINTTALTLKQNAALNQITFDTEIAVYEG